MSRSTSDLVRDSQLQTSFLPNATLHVYHVSDIRRNIRRHRIEEVWQRQKELGRGGFGSVWLENCVLTTDEVMPRIDVRAVKEIRKPLDREGKHKMDYTRELEAVAKFSNEKYHHCFVRSTGWYENDENIFISMEYIEKGDLSSYMNHAFPEPETKQIGAQLVEALQYLHENEFAHRDLKPNNIMVVETGPRWWVKLADFGISKRIGENTTNTAWATAAFAAPEVIGFLPDETVNPFAIDIWALGEVPFRLLTQKPVFDGPFNLMRYSRNEVPFPVDELKSVNAGDECCDFLTKAMVLTPSKRISVVDMQGHPWLQNDSQAQTASSSVFDEATLAKLPTALPTNMEDGFDATKAWTTALQTQNTIGPSSELWEVEETSTEKPVLRASETIVSTGPKPVEEIVAQDQEGEHTLAPFDFDRFEMPYSSLYHRLGEAQRSRGQPLPSQPHIDGNPAIHPTSSQTSPSVWEPQYLKPAFGRTLEYLYARDGWVVPQVVTQCITAVKLYALQTDFIYSDPGSIGNITKLMQKFNKDPLASTFSFRSPESFFHDVHSAANLLLQFLSELPEPVIPTASRAEFLRAATIQDAIVRRDTAHALINPLPDANYATLRALALHLRDVANNSSFNRMHVPDLAKIFAPRVMGRLPTNSSMDQTCLALIFETIVKCASDIFEEG